MLLPISILFVLFAVLLLISVRSRRREARMGWRFRNLGNNTLQYAEFEHGAWRTINFELHLYSKEHPRHVITVPEDWSRFPVWAQERRVLILERLGMKYKEPAFSIESK